MIKFLKNAKSTIFDAICQFLGKTEFSSIFYSYQSSSTLTRYHCALFQINIMSGFPAALVLDRLMDGRTDKHGFIGPFWLKSRGPKSRTETINLKYQEQHGMKNLNYLMDLFLCQIFRTSPNTSSRIMKHLQINHLSKEISTKLRIVLHSELIRILSRTFDTKNYETTWKY